ncbi:MAG: glycoside hydrolase family 127 protein [Anaerolineae bacterium]|nr:glycoside hydrolase family 127 protein [Anaerolineae bacterium]
MTSPYDKISTKPQAYEWIRFGEIKPAGWMQAQMQRDLVHGFVGHLDELVPDLIQKDDIYGKDRLTKTAKTKDLGVVSKETEWEVQFLWWNSETQSNWRDGFVRNTLLLENSIYLEKVREYIKRILATQDADGYLGIYAPDLRFNFNSENGELWAQASLFRVLLGYYEATGETSVLNAVIRAVDVTIQAYPTNQSHPFTVTNDYAGVCHGLVFTDVLDRLYQLTQQEKYLDYALWLYAEYSEATLSADDVRYIHLTDPAYRFRAHGVHTYEHLRSLVTAVYASGNPLLEGALSAYLEKLELCLTPSGAPIGDENINGRQADASEIGYEYCSIHELLDAYSHLLQKTGDPQWGDRIEWLLFNAGQGARHPQESAIAYLKTDNSYSMTGPLHPDDPIDSRNPQTRYKYSPAHQDVAVCCVPNAGRIYPYYVKSMWMRTPKGLFCALYGASELNTEVNGVNVHITEQTNYPFDLTISFLIDVSQPVEFELAFRKPAWAIGFEVQNESEWQEENGVIKIYKIWKAGDKFVLNFQAKVITNQFNKDEHFISYGPLVFARPLNGQAKEGRTYPVEGLRDLYYSLDDSASSFDLPTMGEKDLHLEQQPFHAENPWETLSITTSSKSSPKLLPMGSSILRQITFRQLNK